MTDVAPTEEAPAEEAPAPVLNPEIQAEIDRIRAAAAAEVEAAAAASAAQEERNAKLVAAKQVCVDACGPIAEALAQTTDPRERQALIDFEQRTHAAHKDALEAAYLEHAGQSREGSNPASPGVTDITSNVAALSDASA